MENKTKKTLPSSIQQPGDPEHSGIVITGNRFLTADALVKYLREQRISYHVAANYCREITYKTGTETHTAIGFPNDDGSIEIINPFARILAGQHAIRTIRNGSNEVCVFKDFMDFLSFLSIFPKHPDFPRDYVILNALDLFETARPFMESHALIRLFLGHDPAGRKYTDQASSISPAYQDESSVYKGYRDLNDWLINFGRTSSP
jgi:hypothetical protein